MGAGRSLFVLAVLAAASPVAAQPAEGDVEMEGDAPAEGADAAPAAPVKDPKVAKKWKDAGVQLVRKGDQLARSKPDDAKAQYENAVTAFQNAIAASDDVNLHFDLAGAYDKLGTFDLAATHYRILIKAQGARADLVKKATAKFDELSMKVGLVTLAVKPEGSTISMGGKELARSPMTEPLILMPGAYTLSFAADGYQPKDTEIKVEAGSESERTIELEEVSIVVQPPPPAPDKSEPIVAKAPSMTPIYIGGGVAAGLVGVGVVTGILAVSRHGTFTGDDASLQDRQDAQSSGKTLALVTDVCLVTGIAAAGVTAYWYFRKYKPAKAKYAEDQSASTTAKVDVIPWVQLDAGGVSVAGSF